MAPKYPSIPEPTLSSESLRDSVLTIKQAFEVLTGQRGNEDYRAVLLPELTASDNADDAAIAANTAAIAANTAAIAAHTTAINGKVSKTGDTMSGSLTPSVTGTMNLGSAVLRRGTVYSFGPGFQERCRRPGTTVEGADRISSIYNNGRQRG